MGGLDALLVRAAGEQDVAGGGDVAGVGVVGDVVSLEDAVAVGDDDGTIEGEDLVALGLGVGVDADEVASLW